MKTTIKFQGRRITISSRHFSIEAPAWVNGQKKRHYKITVECGGKKLVADYWQPGENLTLWDLRSCLKTVCNYATYGNMPIEDFSAKFCYDDRVSECTRAYNSCVEALGQFQEMSIDPYKLGDYLREKYDLYIA